MLNSILERVFGCSHRTTTFPMTPARKLTGQSIRAAGNRYTTYVVCLDCGKEFAYDWNAMRVVDPAAARLLRPQSSIV
jgi:hypothetical protein